MTNRRELISMGLAVAAAHFVPTVAAQSVPLATRSPNKETQIPDSMSLVNPELRHILKQFLPGMSKSPPLGPDTLITQRKMFGSLGRPMLPSPTVEERLISGAKGDPDVRIYIAGATPGASKPAVLHMHGGGYVLQAAIGSRRDIQDLVLKHDCVAITVDYRLAPETRFPGALNDNYAALRWLVQHSAELGVDVKRIAIKGESAGGGHAAALAIAARDRGEFPICFQILIYPMLDDRTGSIVHYPQFLGHYFWTPEQNRFGWTSLLGVPAGSRLVRQNSVPARVQDLAGLAPAFIGVGSIDLFVEEDLEFAGRLIRSGVPTELMVVPGAFHGFDLVASNASISRQFDQGWNEALRRAFTTDAIDTAKQ
jgi:acetyl esterase/lipase